MQVRISKPARSAMQSADGKDNWLLEFVKKPNSRFKESLMGRTSSGDMAGEVRLFFPTLEAATDFAEKKHYSYEVIKPREPKLPKKSYASNFG